MLLRFDAILNGVSFAAIDPSVMLLDIVELPPDEDLQTARRAIHPGTRITSRVRRSLSLRMVFVVREYDITSRAMVLDKIAEWAGNGGWLTVNSRPGQRLYVTPEEPPSMGSSLKWTAEMEMTLTAYERPYWEQQWPTKAVISDSGSIRPTGTLPQALVECDVTNAGDSALTTVTVSCGGTHITLEDISVPAGGHVSISYTDAGIMVIMAGNASALASRTADSSDDLVAIARQSNDISVTADQPVSAVFSARGRYR